MDFEALRADLRSTLNKHNIDGATATPDFILADFLVAVVKSYAGMMRANLDWHGGNTPTITMSQPHPSAPTKCGPECYRSSPHYHVDNAVYPGKLDTGRTHSEGCPPYPHTHDDPRYDRKQPEYEGQNMDPVRDTDDVPDSFVDHTTRQFDKANARMNNMQDELDAVFKRVARCEDRLVRLDGAKP